MYKRTYSSSINDYMNMYMSTHEHTFMIGNSKQLSVIDYMCIFTYVHTNALNQLYFNCFEFPAIM